MSLLSRLAAKARSWLNRRTPVQGGEAPRTTGSGTPRDARRANGTERLSKTALDAQRRLRTKTPALTPEQAARQAERAGRGETLTPAELDALREAASRGVITPPPVTPGYNPPGPTPPPVVKGGTGSFPTPPPPPPKGAAGDGEQFDDVETLGRDYSYFDEDFEELQRETVQVSSSNVFGYFYQPESKYSGILYVTFLAPAPKGEKRSGPGPTYAYYDVTRGKFKQFASDANSSPGGAVWDHLRVRGTLWGHQTRYRLISVTGEYIPRKATKLGYRERMLPPVGTPASKKTGPLPKETAARRRELERRGYRRSTLPERLFADSTPDRGYPDRGTPDRG